MPRAVPEFLINGLLIVATLGAVTPEDNIFDNRQYEIKPCLSSDLEVHEKRTCHFYALVIDAGSTGTRLEVFTFSHDRNNPNVPFKLEKETFRERNPGLSAYASEPDLAASVILDLLEEAKQVIPSFLWQHSPVTLRATAGFRLLPADGAVVLLETIERALRESPFLTGDESAAGMLDGTDEGIFGWFTVNYLLNRIETAFAKDREHYIGDRTVVALDLGGGSTQVTFLPRATMPETAKPFMKHVRLFGKTITVYSNSYLGNGIMASRRRRIHIPGQASVYVSSCFPPGVSVLWTFNGEQHYVVGRRNYSAKTCYAEVLRHIQRCSITAVPGMELEEIYAFGYFYDISSCAGMIPTHGGPVKVGDFKKAADRACSMKHLQTERLKPWECTDLTYIYSLLSDGYKIKDNQTINLVKKLQGIETSWALGVAYHLLNTYHEAKYVPDKSINFIGSSVSNMITFLSDRVLCLQYFMSDLLLDGVRRLLSMFNIL